MNELMSSLGSLFLVPIASTEPQTRDTVVIVGKMFRKACLGRYLVVWIGIISTSLFKEWGAGCLMNSASE